MQESRTLSTTSPTESPVAESTWSTPALRLLGDVGLVTQRVDKVGRADGGGGNKRRT